MKAWRAAPCCTWAPYPANLAGPRNDKGDSSGGALVSTAAGCCLDEAMMMYRLWDVDWNVCGKADAGYGSLFTFLMTG